MVHRFTGLSGAILATILVVASPLAQALSPPQRKLDTLDKELHRKISLDLSLTPDNTYNSYVAPLIRAYKLPREPSTGAYPLVSDHVIVKDEKFRYGGFHAEAHYPRLDGGGVDARAMNRYFLNMARSGVSQAEGAAAYRFNSPPITPGGYGVAEFEYSQEFTVNRLGPTLIDLDLETSRNTGGMHANATDAEYLINLCTDGIVPLDRVFASGINWRNELANIATDDYIRKYGNSGRQFYDFLGIREVLQQPSNYSFGDRQLTIFLNYNPPNLWFSIEIPYTQIRRLFRADGPIPPAANHLSSTCSKSRSESQ